jgi:predicted RNase H-like nuclease (RuvC/YqgF family)
MKASEKENLHPDLSYSLPGNLTFIDGKQDKALKKSKDKNRLLKAKVKEQKESLYLMESKLASVQRQLQDSHYRLQETEESLQSQL